MSFKKITGWAAVTVAAFAFGLVSCTPFPQGPAGKVESKDTRYSPATKGNRYYLTVRTPAGTKKEFRVTISDYDDCVRGSAYPKCTQR